MHDQTSSRARALPARSWVDTAEASPMKKQIQRRRRRRRRRALAAGCYGTETPVNLRGRSIGFRVRLLD